MLHNYIPVGVSEGLNVGSSEGAGEVEGMKVGSGQEYDCARTPSTTITNSKKAIIISFDARSFPPASRPALGGKAILHSIMYTNI